MYRFYDFFAGAGLVNLGLRGWWTSAWANDIDPKKAEVYRLNFGADRFALGDVADVNVSSLPPGVDLAWASFPCQDLSLAGWRRGMSAERSGAFWPFWRLMRDLFDRGSRPPILVIENVVGLLYGENFTGLCEALAALGMHFGGMVIDARRFLPQSRPRVFVVAVDARVDCSAFTSAGPPLSPWFPNALLSAVARLPETLQPSWRWWKLPVPSAAVPDVAGLIQDDPAGVEWHSPSGTQRLLRMMSATNLEKVNEEKARGGRSVGFLYKRIRGGKQRAEIRFDGVAGCLRTPNGGSSRQTVLIVDGDVVRSRLLSPRETARLMGAPDSYRLPAKYNDAYRAMGDGVAVPAVAWLSKHLLVPLAKTCRSAECGIRGGFDGETNSRLESLRRVAEARAALWQQPTT